MSDRRIIDLNCKGRALSRPLIDSFIGTCESYEQFHERLKKLSEKDQGDIFERLVQLYLEVHPEYATIVDKVWHWKRVPDDVRDVIGLPKGDEGIDLVARTRDGKYWTIQAKFKGDPNSTLTRKKDRLDSFFSCTSNTCRNIDLAIVAHTVIKPFKKRGLLRNIQVREIGLERWRTLDDNDGEAWRLIVRSLEEGKSVAPNPKTPWPEQQRAIAAAENHFIRDKTTRGRLIMACAAGKTLIAYWIAEKLHATTILVAVPSLQLVRQGVSEWMQEFLANGQKPRWLCVCSDETIGDLDSESYDAFISDNYQLGLPTCTDPKEIAEFLGLPGKRIIFTTYQSSDKVAEAARAAGVTFDFAIFDEAHRTAGLRDKKFATLLRDEFKVKRRMFMTATERIVNGGGEDVFLMMNEEDYGKRFFYYSFDEAREDGRITPYKIVTIVTNEKRDRRIAELIKRNHILNAGKGLTEVRARDLAVEIAVKQMIKEFGIKKAFMYCASIAASKQARDRFDALNEIVLWPQTKNFHVDGNMTVGERDDELRKFKNTTEPTITTNARCLTEGINLPAVDAVVFGSPRRSRVDIVQAAGRAMRKAEGKELGYVLIPINVPNGMSFTKFAKTTAFREIARIIALLAVTDTRIIDELKAIRYGKVPSTKVFEFKGQVPVGLRISLAQFAEAVRTRVWRYLGRMPNRGFKSFEDACAFVRPFEFKDKEAFYRWATSGQRSLDIPSNPQKQYADEWVSWPHFLGNGNLAKGSSRPFEEVHAYALKLGFTSHRQWQQHVRRCRQLRLKEIVGVPLNPAGIYKEWISWPYFLGTGRRSNNDLVPYEKARKFALSRKFRSAQAWFAYCKGRQLPAGIPKDPQDAYKSKGWISWPHFLGNGNERVPFLSFKKAVAIVRAAELKSQKKWRIWSKTKRPKNIPGNPSKVYKKQWKDWAYWLGADLARANLTDKERRAIAKAIASGMSTSAICKKFGRGPTTVGRIRWGKR